uniref:Uncharacterized protein n=1 Tax=Cyanistes caeruleus TaxID=156563 RepID=A0A8C0V1N5_CYACU
MHQGASLGSPCRHTSEQVSCRELSTHIPTALHGCLQLLVSTALSEAGRCWRSRSVSQGQHCWRCLTSTTEPAVLWLLPAPHLQITLHCTEPGRDTHQGPLVPPATSCPCPTRPKQGAGYAKNMATCWTHSLENQSCSGRCWCPGTNCYLFPSKTPPARQQEVYQRGQLGGSRTQGCFSPCSSLEVQFWKISAQPHREHWWGWEVEAVTSSQKAEIPVPGTQLPAGWGKLGISWKAGVVQASLEQLEAAECRRSRENNRMTLPLFHLDWFESSWLAWAVGLGREQSWWGVGLSPHAGQGSEGGRLQQSNFAWPNHQRAAAPNSL